MFVSFILRVTTSMLGSKVQLAAPRLKMSAAKHHSRASCKIGYMQNSLEMFTFLVLILNTFLEHIWSKNLRLFVILFTANLFICWNGNFESSLFFFTLQRLRDGGEGERGEGEWGRGRVRKSLLVFLWFFEKCIL